MIKRLLLLLLALSTALSLCGCSSKPKKDSNPATLSEAEYLPDFTVETVGGGTFTLSEALEDHELVLINLFATWCPPCKREFPYLQEAWAQERDRVAVIALSVEPTDTIDVLQDFTAELGLTFPVGREENTDLARFVTEGIPTTILVDRTGKVAAVEIGAKSSTQEFLDLFDAYSGEDYDPDVCTYTIRAYNARTYAPVEGVAVVFSADDEDTTVTTGSAGAAYFEGTPARYRAQIADVPDGLQIYSQSEWETEPYGQSFVIYLLEDGQ